MFEFSSPLFWLVNYISRKTEGGFSREAAVSGGPSQLWIKSNGLVWYDIK